MESIERSPLRVRTSPFAIASLVCSLMVCCCGLNGAIAIVLALVGLRQIANRPDEYTGRGLAIAGAAVGSLSILAALAFWGFMIHRYQDVKPVAEQVTIHLQQGELEEARALFAESVRSNPGTHGELVRIHEYLSARGELVELNTGYSVEIVNDVTNVHFVGVFESGEANVHCAFVRERGRWRLLRYDVR